MLIPVLVIAGSPSAQRGLATLVPEGFEVVEHLDWTTEPSSRFEVTLGELEESHEPLYLQEPFVILSNEVSLEPGAGRALLSAETGAEEVAAALQAVILGLSVQDDYHLADSAPTSDTHDLTPRELEVLSLIGEGLSNRQIGETLHISQNTVKFHLSSIFSKLQVGSRAEAVTAGLRSGIILL